MHRDAQGNRLYTGILDDLAPLEDMTLSDFVEEFVDLSQDVEGESAEERASRLIQRQEFGLCGRIPEAGRQIRLDATQSDLRDDEVVSFKRDNDSYNGFFPLLPLTKDLYVYPIARHQDTLNSSLHIACEMTTYNGVAIFSYVLPDEAALTNVSCSSKPLSSLTRFLTFAWASSVNGTQCESSSPTLSVIPTLLERITSRKNNRISSTTWESDQRP
jgi:hypothetical protein